MPRVISSVLSPTRSPERRLPGLCTHSCLFRNVWKLCCNWCCGLGNVKDVGGCQGPVGGARKIVARGTKNYGYTIYVYTCTGIWAQMYDSLPLAQLKSLAEKMHKSTITTFEKKSIFVGSRSDVYCCQIEVK